MGRDTALVRPPILDHVALIVGDLEAGVDFYGDRLGLGDPVRLDVPELQLRLAFFVSTATVPLELVEFGGRGELAQGDAVVALQVDDLDAEIARLRAEGTHVFEQPATEALPFRRGWITKGNGHGTVIELCPKGEMARLLANLAAAAEGAAEDEE
jgi:catechol 2,3-dioxygenase-like lactoylglutathione lyase family enzyme